jgi:hypothetical protein
LAECHVSVWLEVFERDALEGKRGAVDTNLKGKWLLSDRFAKQSPRVGMQKTSFIATVSDAALRAGRGGGGRGGRGGRRRGE